MPWTNLAIQRKRLRELSEILGKSIRLHPKTLNDHRNFTASVDGLNGISEKQCIALRENGYEINSVAAITSGTVFMRISCPFDLEKQNRYVQTIAKQTSKKAFHQLNDELKRRQLAALEIEASDLRSGIEERTKTIRQLAHRIIELRGITNV